jgi:hypothetical protein
MKIKVLLFFIAFSLSVSAQHYIGASTLATPQFKYLGCEYLYQANKNISFGIGIGSQFTDSLKLNYDLYGRELKTKYINTSLVIPLEASIKTNTKYLYAFGSGQNLLSLNNLLALVGVLGLGYQYKHFRTQLGVSFYKLKAGVSYEAGYTF